MTTRNKRTTERATRLSLAGRLMPSIMRLRRSNKNHRTRVHVRRHLDRLTARPESTEAPKRLHKGVAVSSSFDQGWRIHTLTPSDSRSLGTVVYLHGGGWISEAVSAHWNFLQKLVVEASVTVIMPVYPLVHHGGTAETVVPFVARLSEEIDGPLILMGDSAGGTIAMSASLLLAQGDRPADLTVLIAPALDLRLENPEIDAIQPLDPWLVKKGQKMLTEMWIGDHTEDPILNPFLGDTRTVGRLLIFSGTRDLLNPDTRIFVRAAENAGANIEYHEQPGHLHVYPFLPTPEGKRARRTIAKAVREAVDLG